MKHLYRVVGILSLLVLVGCDSQPTATQKDKAATDSIMANYGQTQPIPNMSRSQVRESLIQFQKLEGRATATFTVERAQMDGRILRVIPSIGYPIPGGTSLTNPWQVECRGYSSSYGCTAIGQAEPTGVYAPEQSQGTKVIELLPDGSTVAYYTENNVSTYAYPVTQKGEFQIVPAGAPPATSKLNITK